MIPFERSDMYFPNLSANDIVPIPIPGRFFLQKLQVCENGGTAHNATLYNRAFGNPVANIAAVTSEGGKAKIRFTFPHPFQVGDKLTVAGVGTVGYNTTHEVTGGGSDLEVITDQDWTVDSSAGTATLKLIVLSVTRGLATKAIITTLDEHIFQEGDEITVAGSSVGGYNTGHVVTKVLGPNRVRTNIDWTADGIGGTVVLAIGAANQPLYEVLPLTAAASGVVRYEKDFGKPAVNRDVRRKSPRTFIPRLYLKLSATGTYRVAIAGQQCE